MPTESIQLLTPWAFNTRGVYIQKPDGTNYGTKGFAHHPCAKWLYESPCNAFWLLDHAYEMVDEYFRRYGKTHGVSYALEQINDLLEKNYTYGWAKWFDHTEFVQAMPEEFKIEGNPVQAYRNYINGYKGYAEWRHSGKPDWWDETIHEPIRKQYLAEREAKRMKHKHDKHQRVSATL
jgi:hypothetical protein